MSAEYIGKVPKSPELNRLPVGLSFFGFAVRVHLVDLVAVALADR